MARHKRVNFAVQQSFSNGSVDFLWRSDMFSFSSKMILIFTVSRKAYSPRMLMVLVAFPVWPHSVCNGGFPGSLNKKTLVLVRINLADG
jgi:hypothetical protein